MNEEPVVQIKDLTKIYGQFTALDHLTISVDRGQILGFIGPNGAGKTTTIKILVGLARPTSGSASIAGVDCVRDFRQIKKIVGFMPDTFGSYDNMRVREYLDFFGAAYKIPRKDRLKRIGEVLEMTGSTYMQDRFVESLSHGMKQRVSLARTMIHDPKMLILDEPANGLDPQARIEMREILLRLAALGKTLIVTSHILPELSRICNTVAIITTGKLRAFGTLDQIMRNVRQKRVMELQLLSAEHIDRIAEALKQALDDQTQVTISRAEAILRITTSLDDQALANMLTRLTAAGVAVAQFREVPIDLEDAFMLATRGDKTAADATTGKESKP